MLAVEFERWLYLPGGATEEGESPEDALRREFMDETGYSLLGAKPLPGADQFVLTTKGECFRKECSFFIVHVNLASNPPGQPNHLVRWLPLPEGLGHFAEEASRYAAKIAFTGVEP